MRILIYSGTGDGSNLGDLAMLQTTVARLRKLWPAARLQLLSTGSKIFKLHCPGVELVPMRGCRRWFRVGALPGWLFPAVPAAVRAHFPLPSGRLGRLAGWAYPPDFLLAREFANALFNADLLVLAGCGLINDEFQYASLRLLDIFAAAIRCGIPTAMLGQGFGPMADAALCKCAAEVLPLVGKICLREQRGSLPLLKKLGVPEKNITVTGDDAIEFSFRERRPALGACLGVNLRRTGYSGISTRILAEVRAALAEKVEQYQTSALGLPILMGGADSDVQTIDLLLGKTGGHAADGVTDLPELLRRIGECRVVVTGSYHAGVFALAQGIPVVAIAQSAYYRDKFHGLAGQFGAGCRVLRPDDGQFPGQLREAIDRAWNEVETLRETLLLAAEAQVRASQAAYAGLPALIR
jgi:colanic acid/amylovoran biosynthesis protein